LKAAPEGYSQAQSDDGKARWSVKYTKAKVTEGVDPSSVKPVDLAIPTDPGARKRAS